MMKSLVIAGALSLLLLAGCSTSEPTTPVDASAAPALKAAPAPIDPAVILDELPVGVADGLAFMREEEKLAHDVYLVLGQIWGARIYASIMESEQRHTDAVKVLLDRYGLADPVDGHGAGQFANADLQDLYHALVARGQVSLREAALVGKLIEETDIADLDAHLAEVPAGSDIAIVYGNLRAGSVDHLAAFTSYLRRLR